MSLEIAVRDHRDSITEHLEIAAIGLGAMIAQIDDETRAYLKRLLVSMAETIDAANAEDMGEAGWTGEQTA